MQLLNSVSLLGLGVLAGGMIAVQSLLNATLGQRIGNLGSVLVVTIVSIVLVVLLILLFPGTARLGSLPGISEWYLYVGGALGVAILAIPIFLVPRIGTTSMLASVVLGQFVIALVIDQLGLFATPQIGATLPRIFGVVLIAAGAILVSK